jgi:hypothetical protein
MLQATARCARTLAGASRPAYNTPRTSRPAQQQSARLRKSLSAAMNMKYGSV